MSNLEEFRDEIDDIDKKIVELFEQRMEIVSNVAKYKVENRLPILNSLREEELIKRNTCYLRNKELQRYLKDLFIKLMELSKDYQSQQINEYKSNL